LSIILYEELISSQPRYDHFDTSPCPVIISGIRRKIKCSGVG